MGNFHTAIEQQRNKSKRNHYPQKNGKYLDKFYTNINKSLDAACPMSKAKTVDKNNPWWNPDLESKRNHLQKKKKTPN